MKKHSYRLQRSYQFPNAATTIVDGTTVGYVVNLSHQNNLYGVVKYVVHKDTIAYVESPTHFNTDKVCAEEWVKSAMIKAVTDEEDSTYIFDAIHNEKVQRFELDLYNNRVLVYGYSFERVLSFTTLEELKQILFTVDQQNYTPEDIAE